MTKLPSIYQSIFYVYFHRHPDTREILYVGKGSRGRAWHCAESNSRGKDHAEFLDMLIQKGYTPDSWVEIYKSCLSSSEAFDLEKEIIWGLDQYPIYNSKNDSCCKMTVVDIENAQELRDSGFSYSDIGNAIGLSTMTIYRALNGQTKNYR